MPPLLRTFFRLSIFGFPLVSWAQIPVITKKGWSYAIGNVTSVPILGNYLDFSLTRGSDYFWEYSIDPQTTNSFFGWVQADRPIELQKGYAFLSYGGGYNSQCLKIRYSGWEGGGFSGSFAQGEGIKKITNNYLS